AQMLWNLPSVTPSLPLGGGANAPQSFAVRGPDPTETLVAIDGHMVNNGNTGDFDLSLIDPAALQSVEVVYGIAPSSLIGPNTLGGAIDVVTLEPTTTPTFLARAFTGSFGSFGETLQATGTSNRLGYAFSAHRATSGGEVNQTFETVDGPAFVGSAFDGASLLSKLRYEFGGAGGYVQLDFRDQSVYKDMSALLTAFPLGDSAAPDYAGTSLAAHNAGYGFDLATPLGKRAADGIPQTTLQFSHLTSLAAQSVAGPGAETSPYLYNDRDVIGDDWLELDRALSKGELSLKADVFTESLRTDFVAGKATDNIVSDAATRFDGAAPTVSSLLLAQTQRSLVLRYDGDPSSRFHYSLAGYLSDFSTFGWSFDPRAGIVWTPTASTALRATVGSTFQTPQLTALFVPSPLPPPNADGLISVGNPNLQPDRATEYDLGWDQLFGSSGRQTRVTVDLYRTNLRTPITQYIPANANPRCVQQKKPCSLTFPINAGGQVYTGAAIEARQQLGRDFALHATWSAGSSYLTSSYPNSNVVLGEQTLGEPLHKASFGFERDAAKGLVYAAGLSYFGTYNQLNRPPFATLDASLAYRWKNFEIGLYGTNLTDVYDGRFTAAGAGVPYGGSGGTPIPTDAYVLPGTKVVLGISARM
ncbi:MAG TPA: TonB-dependent receptor, partial [Candidatus Cybelea sp.]|nr:TonB-dependent receptor [Candidatus Cybelea sp.]